MTLLAEIIPFVSPLNKFSFVVAVLTALLISVAPPQTEPQILPFPIFAAVDSFVRHSFVPLFVTASPTSSPSSSSERKLESGSTCFVGSADCDTHRQPQNTFSRRGVHQCFETAQTKIRSSIMMTAVTGGDDCTLSGTQSSFDLQKARLAARFSSVAYEDPPAPLSPRTNSKSNDRRSPPGKAKDEKLADHPMAGVEQFVDEYGVTITRPDQNDADNDISKEVADDDDIAWNMAHIRAMSPRPLMLMLSKCNDSGLNSSLTDSRFQWVALASNLNTSTQFDVWRIMQPFLTSTSGINNIAGGRGILVIAFRGTRLSSFTDLLTDIQLKQDMVGCSNFGVCMDDDGADNESNSTNQPSESDGTIMAHSGFSKAYASIRPTLLHLLSDYAGSYDQIWMTGHSLGAALATLAVVDVGTIISTSAETIKSSQIPMIPKVKLSSYVFGAPRVGNKKFSEQLARLQQPQQTTKKAMIQEYFRINTQGDAVVFLPRGKEANRLDIDYIHAGATVFLPALFAKEEDFNGGIENESWIQNGELNAKHETKESISRNTKKNESLRQWMMRLEEEAVQRINRRLASASNRKNSRQITLDDDDDNLTKIRIYPKGDQPPDPLSEVDPNYSGFFPLDPRLWASSTSFENFLLGESVRAFRILRGGFVKNHRLTTYEESLCRASQNEIIVVDSLK